MLNKLTKHEILPLSKLHEVRVMARLPVAECRAMLADHTCGSCGHLLSIFKRVDVPSKTITRTNLVRARKSRRAAIEPSNATLFVAGERDKIAAAKLKAIRKKSSGRSTRLVFPPRPLTSADSHRILTKYCRSIRPRVFMERGCAVCGYLTKLTELTPLSEYKGDLDLLIREGGVTRRERFSSNDPIEDLKGPILAENCHHVCVECQLALDNGVVPKLALARYNWVGPVPDVLKDLTFAESIMIAKIRHNRCVVRVNSGRVRMSANAIMFSQPILKV
ncbi:hypothetical protein C8R47DRAFT_962537, partial [Mycena vitilis]